MFGPVPNAPRARLHAGGSKVESLERTDSIKILPRGSQRGLSRGLTAVCALPDLTALPETEVQYLPATAKDPFVPPDAWPTRLWTALLFLQRAPFERSRRGMVLPQGMARLWLSRCGVPTISQTSLILLRKFSPAAFLQAPLRADTDNGSGGLPPTPELVARHIRPS